MSGSLESAQSLAGHVKTWVEARRVVGAELLVVEDGQILVHEAHGCNDPTRGQRLVKDSLYRVRSMTKPLVATAVAMLAEEGALGIDDPVAAHLPSWDNPRSRDVCLRQLLHHVGGFDQDGWPEPLRSYARLRDAVDAIGERGPARAPGSRFEYSDLDGATLGAVVAQLVGMPIERFLETRIFEPLGMRSSYFDFRPDAPWATRVNRTHRKIPGGDFECYWDPTMTQVVPFFRASGGLYCSARDYARFLSLWLGLGETKGVRLLSESSIRAALEPGPFGRYGMFWDLPSNARSGELPESFGHVGTDGTLALAVPERRLLLLYFTQSRGRSAMQSFSMRAGDAFGLRGPMPKFTCRAAETELEIVTLDAQRLARCVGTYSFGDPDKRLVFSERDGVLHTWLRGDEVHLIPVSQRAFALGWVRASGGIELRLDEDVRLVFGSAEPGPAQFVEIQRQGSTRAKGERELRSGIG